MAHNTRSHNGVGRRIAIAVLGALASVCVASAPVMAQGASAEEVLKSMADYMASQNNLSAQFDVELEIITPGIQKLQFTGSGDVLLNRPNRRHTSRKGGYSDTELFYDGKTATVVDRHGKAYAHPQAPGSVDKLIDLLRSQYNIEMPGADLFLTKSYDELMSDVIEAHHIGIGVVDGVDCEHLAFRNSDTDWQIWVRTGDKPLPCKYVITSKTVAAAPQYSIRFYDWKSGMPTDPDAFAYAPAAGAKSVAFNDLANIGELPPPVPLKVDKR